MRQHGVINKKIKPTAKQKQSQLPSKVLIYRVKKVLRLVYSTI